ncbi:myxosortase family intramembrane protease [Haliangium sp.]|uniref:myxosortase family intramembrane protease n=1 Tax=Haliangium sp. TaxID=2663208 RepID=UPI003D0AE0E1
MHTDLKHAAIAFVSVSVAVAALVHIDVELPLVGHLGSALVAVVFLYAPVLWAWRRDESLVDYGFTSAPLGRGLAIGLGVPMLIFPLFALVTYGFYELVCGLDWLASLAPPGACPRWHRPSPGLALGGAAALAWLELVAVQLVVVALPEELFFRGLLLTLLERVWPPTRRLAGGGIGWALVVSALAFALIHLPKDGDPRALMTFFPGLLFGWMRSTTGSILAPVLAHAASNVFIRVLDQVMF